MRRFSLSLGVKKKAPVHARHGCHVKSAAGASGASSAGPSMRPPRAGPDGNPVHFLRARLGSRLDAGNPRHHLRSEKVCITPSHALPLASCRGPRETSLRVSTATLGWRQCTPAFRPDWRCGHGGASEDARVRHGFRLKTGLRTGLARAYRRSFV
ncbi:hypothetical protein MRX96_007064 [Rhipicephalus microplus]